MFATLQDLKFLQEEVRQLVYNLDGSGALMATKPSAGIPEPIRQCPNLMLAIKEISGFQNLEPLHVMINLLRPGVDVPIHRDFLTPTSNLGQYPCLERWHLPILTNLESFWWDEEAGTSYMPLGIWTGPVKYWLKHKVWNNGKTDRIHLVVDLDSFQPVGSYKED